MILINSDKIVEFPDILQYFDCKDPEYAGVRIELLHQYYFDQDAIRIDSDI